MDEAEFDEVALEEYGSELLPPVAGLRLQTGPSLTPLELIGFGDMSASEFHTIALASPGLRSINLDFTLWQSEDFQDRFDPDSRETCGYETIVAAMASLPHLVEVDLGTWPILAEAKMDSEAYTAITEYCKTRNIECTMRLCEEEPDDSEVDEDAWTSDDEMGTPCDHDYWSECESCAP